MSDAERLDDERAWSPALDRIYGDPFTLCVCGRQRQQHEWNWVGWNGVENGPNRGGSLQGNCQRFREARTSGGRGMFEAELKPCPFCKSKNLRHYADNGYDYRVDCDDCGTRGPSASSREAAAKAWNRRRKAK